MDLLHESSKVAHMDEIRTADLISGAAAALAMELDAVRAVAARLAAIDEPKQQLNIFSVFCETCQPSEALAALTNVELRVR
jgi:hypothetical protein